MIGRISKVLLNFLQVGDYCEVFDHLKSPGRVLPIAVGEGVDVEGKRTGFLVLV